MHIIFFFWYSDYCKGTAAGGDLHTGAVALTSGLEWMKPICSSTTVIKLASSTYPVRSSWLLGDSSLFMLPRSHVPFCINADKPWSLAVCSFSPPDPMLRFVGMCYHLIFCRYVCGREALLPYLSHLFLRGYLWKLKTIPSLSLDSYSLFFV